MLGSKSKADAGDGDHDGDDVETHQEKESERDRLLPAAADPLSFNRLEKSKDYLKIVLPISCTSLANSATFFLMTKWLSFFEDGLAASAYVVALQTLILEPVTNLMTQAANEVGKNYGVILSKDPEVTEEQKTTAAEEIGAVFRQTTIMAIITTIPSVGFLVAAKPVLRLMGQPDGPVNLAGEIFIPFAIGMLPQQILRGQYQILAGLTKVPSIVVVLGSYAVVVSGLGCLMMFPFELGPSGYGWAFCATSYLYAGGLMVYLGLGKDFSKYKLFTPHLNRPDLLKKLFLLGTPTGFRVLMEEIGLTISSILAGKLGAEALDSAQAVNQYVYIGTAFIIFAASVHSAMVSQARGMNNFRLARFYGKLGYGLGLVTTGLCMPIFVGAHKPLVELFSDDSAVIAASQMLFLIQGGNLILDSVRNFSATSLRGFDDNTPTMLFNLAGLIILAVSGYFMGQASALGITGVYLGRAAGIFAAGALTALRWYNRSNQAVKRGTLEAPAEDRGCCNWKFWKSAPRVVEVKQIQHDSGDADNLQNGLDGANNSLRNFGSQV